MTVADICFRSDLIIMFFRSEQQKRDPYHSWHRPNRSFFATGACHILAGAFLETFPNEGYQALFICPAAGLRGSHVFVSNGKWVFDYHGVSEHHRFLAHYFAKMNRFSPEWRGEIIPLKESPISESFCKKYNHRLPNQYLHDPLARAFSYLLRFKSALTFTKECDGHRPPLQL